MHITGVRIHHLEARLRERFGWSLNWTDRRRATLVEVTTDSGLTGWGDGHIDASLLAAHPELVIGRSPLERDAIHDDLRRPGVYQTRTGAPTAPGLDLALWDLCGKALGMPASALFGRRYRDRVPAYCTALYRKDWPHLGQGLAEEAREWVRQGFRAVKMKIGYGPEADVEIAAAVRGAVGPSIALGVDSNCAYDAGTAMRIGRALEPLDLMWWEEPLMADDLEGYARLRQAIRVPLAGGETGDLDWLTEHYVQRKAVDVLQPDLEYVGLTGARALTHLCWLNRIRLVPHVWGTAIRTAATLHWMACCPPLTPALAPPAILFEFDRTESPFRDAVVRERIALDASDGAVPVPRGPGLGVTVIPEAVETFRVELVEIA